MKFYKYVFLGMLSCLLLNGSSSHANQTEFCYDESFCEDECVPFCEDQLPFCCEYSECCRTTKIEVKLGYFFFVNDKMRRVYNNGGIDVQLSGSRPIWKWLDLYGSIEYQYANGKSLNGHQSTSIWKIPVNLGLRPIFQFKQNLEVYATIGPRYFYVQQDNKSNYVPRHNGQSGVGFFVNTGAYYTLCNNFVFDVFGEYSWEQMCLPVREGVYRRNLQIGGFTFGAGLGYTF